MATTLTPSQLAAHVDLSLNTFRYREQPGLMPRVQRLPARHRRNGESDPERLDLAKCRLETGIPIRHTRCCADTFGVTVGEATP